MPSAISPQALTALRAARRHEDRDVGAGAIVELDPLHVERRAGEVTSSPRSSARMMTIASRSVVSERRGVEAHALDRVAEPRADAEPRPPAGQFVERADLHGDQRRMPADTD